MLDSVYRALPGTRQFPACLLASMLEQPAHHRMFSGSREAMPCGLVRLSSRLDQMTSTTMSVMSSCCVLEAGCQRRISESS